jgi:ubiquitin carboxyl-terminal hydrolase 8
MTSYKYDIYKHHQLSYPKEKYTKSGLTGIVNLGNRCYNSSIVQCLSNTLKLTDIILTDKENEVLTSSKNKSKKEWLVTNSYINLIRNIWESNHLIKPRSFLDNFGKLYPKFANNNQQDSHEFMMYLLDALHLGFSYEINVDIKGTIQTNRDKLMKLSMENWKTTYEKNYSILVDIFHGVIFNDIQCNNCDNSSIVFEPYTSLSIPVSHDNLIGCLDSYFEKNEHVETWKCDKCKKMGCKKSIHSWSFPDYLVVHLKRFTSSGTKITNHIDYPVDNLDLTKYITEDKGDPNNYIYELYAVNYHSGSLQGGHYWSSCKNLDDNWYLYNDACVTKYNDNTINSIVSKEAYILFYRRKYIKSSD